MKRFTMTGYFTAQAEHTEQRLREDGDQRSALGGWAPGEEPHRCDKCSLLYAGAEESTTCAPCAYRDDE